MSVLIKGMEMPDMAQAYTGLIIGWDGKVYSFIPPQGHKLGESVATAVPVPPHGDLIDRDKFRETMFIGEQCLYSWDELEDAINYAPTIISAEEEV